MDFDLSLDEISSILDSLLDDEFKDIADPVVEKILVPRIVYRRFDDLEREVQETGRFDIHGTNYLAVLAAIAPYLNRVSVKLRETGNALANSAFLASDTYMQMILGGYSPAILGEFNHVDPEAISSALGYLYSDPFEDLYSGFTNEVLQDLRDVTIAGILSGQNPLTTAADLRYAIDTIPVWESNTLLRTVQLTSFRDANVVHNVANSHIISGQIRIATLDDRTCIACIAEHGSELETGDRVDDHHNGRCTSISIIRGFEKPEIQSGADWFDELSPIRQESIMGKSMYAAYRDNQVSWSDFSVKRIDPVFGQQIQAASLKGIIGSKAKDYYTSNRK